MICSMKEAVDLLVSVSTSIQEAGRPRQPLNKHPLLSVQLLLLFKIFLDSFKTGLIIPSMNFEAFKAENASFYMCSLCANN